jgi:hypothetical protein
MPAAVPRMATPIHNGNATTPMAGTTVPALAIAANRLSMQERLEPFGV